MRMCGHAHHDDMLYLGKDPQPSWDYPPLHDAGYADRELYEFWARARSDRRRMPRASRRTASSSRGDLDALKKWADELVESAGAAR